MLALHDLDESLRKRHRHGVAGLALALNPHQGQGADRRQDREAPVDRIRYFTIDVPGWLAGFRCQRIEQRRSSRRFGG